MAEYTPVVQKFPPQGSEEYQRQQVRKQAIQPDTTIEELALGPGRLALAGAKSLAKKLVSSPKGKVPDFKIGSQVDDGESRVRNLFEDNYFPRIPPAVRKEKEYLKNQKIAADTLEDLGKNALRKGYADLGASVYKQATERNKEPKDNKADEVNKSYAKGGSVSSRADGCAQRGKTKGRIV